MAEACNLECVGQFLHFSAQLRSLHRGQRAQTRAQNREIPVSAAPRRPTVPWQLETRNRNRPRKEGAGQGKARKADNFGHSLVLSCWRKCVRVRVRCHHHRPHPAVTSCTTLRCAASAKLRGWCCTMRASRSRTCASRTRSGPAPTRRVRGFAGFPRHSKFERAV